MKGFIDPRLLPADSLRTARLLADVRRRGLSVHLLHAQGTAVRVSGPGVHLIAAAITNVQHADLAPIMARAR